MKLISAAWLCSSNNAVGFEVLSANKTKHLYMCLLSAQTISSVFDWIKIWIIFHSCSVCVYSDIHCQSLILSLFASQVPPASCIAIVYDHPVNDCIRFHSYTHRQLPVHKAHPSERGRGDGSRTYTISYIFNVCHEWIMRLPSYSWVVHNIVISFIFSLFLVFHFPFECQRFQCAWTAITAAAEAF